MTLSAEVQKGWKDFGFNKSVSVQRDSWCYYSGHGRNPFSLITDEVDFLFKWQLHFHNTADDELSFIVPTKSLRMNGMSKRESEGKRIEKMLTCKRKDQTIGGERHNESKNENLLCLIWDRQRHTFRQTHTPTDREKHAHTLRHSAWTSRSNSYISGDVRDAIILVISSSLSAFSCSLPYCKPSICRSSD